MISRRPRGEHLSGSIKHTHAHRDTLMHIHTRPCGSDMVIAAIRQCKVLDGPDLGIGFTYQSK